MMSLQDLRDWYDDLELRQKLEENQSMVIVGLLVLIVFCLGLVMCQLFGGGPGSYSNEVELVYFDTADQSIRIVEHTYPALPQSPLEGTTDVFLASVFGCEECPKGQIKDGMTLEDLKANGMFIGWLEQIDPDINDEMAMFGEGYMYRSVDDDRWYKPTDKGYEELNKRVYDKCATARICLP